MLEARIKKVVIDLTLMIWSRHSGIKRVASTENEKRKRREKSGDFKVQSKRKVNLVTMKAKIGQVENVAC